MRLVVFDDDPAQAEELLAKVMRHPRSSQFDAEVITDIDELKPIIASDDLDILLIDIRIEGEQTDGIELIRRYLPAQSPAQIIFVTGFDTYHSSAYRARHMWFLMKPVQQGQLNEALDTAMANLEGHADKPLLLHTSAGVRAVIPRKLRYAESSGHKLLLHVGDETIEIYGKLSELAGLLPDRFVQCHKSFLVNMGFIEGLSKAEAVLTTGERIPVSQKRSSAVRDEFSRFVGRGLAERVRRPRE